MLDWGTDQHAKSYNIFLVKLTDTQPWMNFFTQITTKLKLYSNSLCSLNTVLTLLFCELWKHGWKHWVMHKITQVVKNIKCFNNYIHIIHSKQIHLGLLKQSDHKITILHWGVPDLALVVCLCQASHHDSWGLLYRWLGNHYWHHRPPGEIYTYRLVAGDLEVCLAGESVIRVTWKRRKQTFWYVVNW